MYEAGIRKTIPPDPYGNWLINFLGDCGVWNKEATFTNIVGWLLLDRGRGIVLSPTLI